jgi:hypothetical protein
MSLYIKNENGEFVSLPAQASSLPSTRRSHNNCNRYLYDCHSHASDCVPGGIGS